MLKGRYRGRTRLAVNQGHFAEKITRAQNFQDDFASVFVTDKHFHASGNNCEQRVADGTLGENHVALGNMFFQRQVVHDDEIGIAQIFEKRYGP